MTGENRSIGVIVACVILINAGDVGPGRGIQLRRRQAPRFEPLDKLRPARLGLDDRLVAQLVPLPSSGTCPNEASLFLPSSSKRANSKVASLLAREVNFFSRDGHFQEFLTWTVLDLSLVHVQWR